MRRAIVVSLGFTALAAVSAAAPSGQVRGTISYGRNSPAAGAIVIVRPEGAASPVRLATTGTSGTFAFDGLADGTYRVEVRRDGSVPIVKSGIKVRAPFRAVVEVLLLPGEAPRAEATTVDGSASIAGFGSRETTGWTIRKRWSRTRRARSPSRPSRRAGGASRCTAPDCCPCARIWIFRVTSCSTCSSRRSPRITGRYRKI
jgi:hypothetical protein